MKRRDVVRALLTPDPVEGDNEQGGKPPTRVASTAVRALGLEIGRLTDEAREAADLRRRIESGASVVELDPALVEPSFISDRISRTSDADYRRLVESIREAGQQVPILVRPHPDQPGRYQIAYGHRRREAATETGLLVRAIVRPLSDAELVIAQGKENAERRNLSFIERALFAAELERRGFDRVTLNSALAVHTAEMTRFLAVAAAVPADLARKIGPAPKIGRPRWMEFARSLNQPGALTALNQVLDQPSFTRMSSDRRFDSALAVLRRAEMPDQPRIIRNAKGDPVVRIERAGTRMRLTVDERLAPTFGDFLALELPDLLARFEAGN
jgi:ParB family transcriptional regulator, chromosome partitioning protein